MGSGLSGALGGLVDLLLPPACPVCDELLDRAGEIICPACRYGFDPLPGETTRTLGADCEIRAGFHYGGAAREAIAALKFRGRRELARPLSQMTLGVLHGWPAERFDLLMPVPLHPGRLAERGFNQAALLARAFARQLNLPVSQALVRTRPTLPQGQTRGPIERQRNVAAVFQVRDARAVEGRRICLVDDVVTTGATLSSCARALRAAGAGSVGALCVACAEPG